MSSLKQSLVVAGLQVHVFSDPSTASASVPVTALFFLRGRLSSSDDVEKVAGSLIQLTREAEPKSQRQQRDLIVITFVIIEHHYSFLLADSDVFALRRIKETMALVCSMPRQIMAGVAITATIDMRSCVIYFFDLPHAHVQNVGSICIASKVRSATELTTTDPP